MKLIFLSLALVQLVLSVPLPTKDNAFLVKELSQENYARIASGNYKQNIEELSGQTEGDMVLTKEQEEQRDGHAETGRTGLIATRYRWPNKQVPYVLHSVFSSAQAAYILEGMREIERVSCITFVPRTTQSAYVEVTGTASGCFANVGHLGSGRQQVNLQLYNPGEGCFRMGTIIHEFLHTLGFYHMQSATERHNYVRIAWENITPGYENNFNTYGADRISNFGKEYDVESVMHYGPYGFSKNGEPTIIPHNLALMPYMGQRIGMTNLDIGRLNAMYQC